MPFRVQSHRLTKQRGLDPCKESFLYGLQTLIQNLFVCNISKLLLLLLFWIQDLPNDLKGRNESKKYCISGLASEFPENCKFYPAETKDDIHKVHSAS